MNTSGQGSGFLNSGQLGPKRRRSGAFNGGLDPAKRNLIIVGALVIGCSVAIVGISFSSSQAKEFAAPAAPVPIVRAEQTGFKLSADINQEQVDAVVPVRNIQRGEYLSADMFKVVRRPKYLSNASTVMAISEVEGRFAAVDIQGDTPVNRNAISNIQAANEIIAQIPVGSRGVTIQTNATTSVEGWARPGAAVDVHWIGVFNGQQASQVIVQNARVLSAERSARPQADQTQAVPSTVTLMVPERDAVRIALASSEGQLVLQLRGANDSSKTTSTDGVMRLVDMLDGDNREDKVEGVVKVRGPGGEVEELALIDGQLHRK